MILQPSWSDDFNAAVHAQAEDAVRAAGIGWSSYAVALAEGLIRRDLGMDQVRDALRASFRFEAIRPGAAA